jgi:hypothetical protein
VYGRLREDHRCRQRGNGEPCQQPAHPCHNGSPMQLSPRDQSFVEAVPPAVMGWWR